MYGITTVMYWYGITTLMYWIYYVWVYFLSLLTLALISKVCPEVSTQRPIYENVTHCQLLEPSMVVGMGGVTIPSSSPNDAYPQYLDPSIDQ